MPNQPCNSQKICIFAIEKAYYMSYYKRTADALLQDLLDAFGAVLIEGPKWCQNHNCVSTCKQHFENARS